MMELTKRMMPVERPKYLRRCAVECSFFIRADAKIPAQDEKTFAIAGKWVESLAQAGYFCVRLKFFIPNSWELLFFQNGL